MRMFALSCVVCTVPTEQDLTNLPRSKRKKLKKKIRQQKERTEDLLYEHLRQLQIRVRFLLVHVQSRKFNFRDL